MTYLMSGQYSGHPVFAL